MTEENLIFKSKEMKDTPRSWKRQGGSRLIKGSKTKMTSDRKKVESDGS